MRQGRWRFDRTFWLLGLVALVLAVLSVVLDLTHQQDRRPAIGQADALGPWALSAAFHSLQRQGLPVQIRVQDITELENDEATLVLATPTVQAVSDEQAQALLRFVEQGNRLVYFSWCGISDLKAVFGRQQESSLLENLGVECHAEAFIPTWLKPETVTDPDKLVETAKEMEATFLEEPRSDTSLAVWNHTPPLWLESEGKPRFESVNPRDLPLFLTVNHDALGLHLVRGEGEILILPLEPFSNQALDKRDHLRLLFHLLPDPQERDVIFWEYPHHPHAGHRLADLWWEYRLWLASLLFVLLVGLWVYGRSRPFGNPIASERLSHQDQEMDHLRALSSLMKHFRLEHDAVGFLLDQLHQELKSRQILPADSDLNALIDLARRGGMNMKDLKQLEAIIASLRRQGALSRHDALALASLLHQIEQTWLPTRR